MSVEAASSPPGRGGPPGGCRPGSAGWPQCQGAGLQIDAGWEPSIGTPGQPFTYTLGLIAGGVLPATNTELDLEMLGNQKFVSFDAGTTGWFLMDAAANITNTVRISVGSMQPGQKSGHITITTVFPDVDRAILRQYANVTWNDNNGFTSRGRAMDIQVDTTHLLNPPSPVVNPALPPAAPPLAALAAPAFMPVADPGPTVTNAHNWYFAATGHTLNDQLGFLSYWLGHGSVAVLGFPLSEVYVDTDTGFQSQYFERGVLEAHPNNPEPYKVELRSLGRETSQAQPAIQPGAPPSPGSVFYFQTGHWLDARFAAYWQNNGGLMQFGFPISEPVTQSDGKVVQWFERARFEYSLSSIGYPLVQLGLVGRESAVHKGYLPY